MDPEEPQMSFSPSTSRSLPSEVGSLSDRLCHAMLQSPRQITSTRTRVSRARRSLWEPKSIHEDDDDWIQQHEDGTPEAPRCTEGQIVWSPSPGAWYLPSDVMSIIAAYLSHDDLKYSRLACKEWNHSITKAVLQLQPGAIRSMADLHNFGGLKHLDLSRCRGLRDEDIAGISSLSSLQSIKLDGCDNLTDAGIEEVAGLTSLTSLSLKHVSKITDISIWMICRSWEHLYRKSRPKSPMVSPSRYDSSYLGSPYSKYQPNDHLLKLAPPPLKMIDLSGCTLLTEQAFACLHKKLPFLEELIIGGISRLASVSNESLVEVGQLNFLTSLDMSGCSAVSESGLHGLKTLVYLRRLNLWNCLRLNSASLSNIKGFRSLEQIGFRGCCLIDDTAMQHLQVLTNLQSLDLRACENIRGETLHYLSKLQRLTHLSCRGCYSFTNTGMASLASLRFLVKLQMQDCWQITDSGMVHLSTLTRLQDANFSACRNLSNRTDNPLGGLVGMTSLTYLSLRGCDQLRLGALESCRIMKYLRTIDLSGCRGLCSKSLAPLIHCPRLECVNVQHCVGLMGISSLDEMKKLKHLKSVNLGGCTSIIGVCLSGKWDCSDSLERLSLDSCINVPLLDRGFADIGLFPQLTFLSLQGCNTLTDDGVRNLNTLKTLQIAQFSDCSGINGSGFEFWPSLTSLTSLQLQGCTKLEDDGLTFIAERFPNLKELNLRNARKITDTGIKSVSKYLKNLRSLSVQSMEGLTDEGVASLNSLVSLRSLEIQFCWRFGDDGIAALTNLGELVNLDLLYSWKITDEGILAILRNAKSLTRINILGLHRLTPSGKREIEKLLPPNGCLGFQ